MSEFRDLDRRSREIFDQVVQGYLASGDPIGSRTLSHSLSEKISPATIRNVMVELEGLGLLGSPHISAGRMPTELGLRFFVDGLLEMKSLPTDDQVQIERTLQGRNQQSENELYAKTGDLLSNISKSASLVFSRRVESPLKHIDFVQISPDQALVVLVSEDGQIDNRLFKPPLGLTTSDMTRAANFINAHIQGHSLDELQKVINTAIEEQRSEIDEMMASLLKLDDILSIEVQSGSQLVVRGRSHLINDAQTEQELEILRSLMDDLENKRDLVELLSLAESAQAVRVFIGSENKLFSLKSSSLVVSPYMNGEGKIIGAVGVIGPTRLNYARIVPMVSYTANLIGKLIDKEDRNEPG